MCTPTTSLLELTPGCVAARNSVGVTKEDLLRTVSPTGDDDQFTSLLPQQRHSASKQGFLQLHL